MIVHSSILMLIHKHDGKALIKAGVIPWYNEVIPDSLILYFAQLSTPFNADDVPVVLANWSNTVIT